MKSSEGAINQNHNAIAMSWKQVEAEGNFKDMPAPGINRFQVKNVGAADGDRLINEDCNFGN